MPASRSQKLIGAYIERDDAERFETWARETDGGTSAALRRLIVVAIDGRPPSQPKGVGTGKQVGVRLRPSELEALSSAAEARGCTPANWLRSLALVHLQRRPQWNTVEIEMLREVFRELRAIGNNVNQIARALNLAAISGLPSEMEGSAAKEAAERVQAEMRRVTAIITGNFDYWGLPDADRPSAAPGAIAREAGRVGAVRLRQRQPARKRPNRFQE